MRPHLRTGGITAAEVEASLPRTYFVKRGDIQRAFGLTREETAALIDDGTFRAEYPVKNGRARFVRAKIVAIARRWESAA